MAPAPSPMHEEDDNALLRYSEPTNEQRRSWAREALQAFNSAVGDAPDVTSDIRDLIADLLHLCDEVGLDPHAEVRSALDAYRTERFGDR